MGPEVQSSQEAAQAQNPRTSSVPWLLVPSAPYVSVPKAMTSL